MEKADTFLNELLTDEEVQLVVSRRLDRDDVRVVGKTEAPLTDDDVAGVMSEQSRVKITVEDDGGDVSTLSFFVKFLPRRLAHRAQLKAVRVFFAREVTFYRRYGSLFTRADACFPRCYLVRDDLLVLEDLAEEGFRILDHGQPFDYEHCAVALTTLARFHAATLDLDDCDFASVTFAQKAEELDKQTDAMVQASTALAEMVTESRMTVDTLHQVVSRGLAECLSLVNEGVAGSGRHVLCHFDLWCNNVLFAHDAEGRPTDARLVDFQQSLLAPPALDVCMLLHLTTSASFREKHLESLLDLYWKRQGRLTPRVELESLYEKFSKICSCVAFFYSSTIFVPRQLVARSLHADDNFVQEKIKTAKELFLEDEGFRSRIMDVMNCFVNHNYTDQSEDNPVQR